MTELETSDFYPNMAQNVTPKRKTKQEKTDNLVQAIFQGHKSFTIIANELGISRRTAYRYWNQWKQSEEAQQVDWEWWSLYQTVKHVNPSKALECLTRIKHRMITEKLEVKEEYTEKHVEELNVTMRNYEAAIHRVVNRYAPEDDPKQPLDTPQTPPTPT